MATDDARGDVILSQDWGGLGDNLQFSTLPELFHGQGRRVFISSKNAYRTPEIHKLVWQANPFISGFSDEPANAGAVLNGEYLKLSHIPNFIQRWERAHNLRSANRYPKIYYQPTLIPELAQLCVADFNSTTTRYGGEQVAEFVTSFQKLFSVPAASIIQTVFPQKFTASTITIGGVETMMVRDIFHYCDIIHSCKYFITVFSGACVMASALRGEAEWPSIHCLAERKFFNSGIFIFDNVRYSVT